MLPGLGVFGDIAGGIGDFLTGGDCGGILGGASNLIGGVSDFLWTYRDEISFGLALVGTITCPMCAAPFYGGMGALRVSAGCDGGE